MPNIMWDRRCFGRTDLGNAVTGAASGSPPALVARSALAAASSNLPHAATSDDLATAAASSNLAHAATSDTPYPAAANRLWERLPHGVVGETGVAYGVETSNQVGNPRARACDERLASLLRSERALDQYTALGLARVWDERRYRTLGHVRASDYVQERLGMKLGRARWLAKLGRAIGQHTALREALSSGRLNASQVLELVPVVGACSEVERLAWIDRAAPLTVNALRALVRAATVGRGPESVGNGNGQGTGTSKPDLADAGGIAEDAGMWFSTPAPARVGELWSLGTSLARKAAGHHLPPFGCAELIAADYLAFVGDDTLANQDARHGKAGARHDGVANGRNGLGTLAQESSRGTLESLLNQPRVPGLLLQRPAPETGDAAFTPGKETASEFTAIEHATDAWELHAALKRLEERRRRLRLELGQELHQLNRCKGWSAPGFDSFAHYCDARLGISKRRATDLIRIYCRLKRFKRLRRAYLSGALHYSKVRSLLRVVRPPTERLWLEWARGLSCREVDAVTEYAQLYVLNKMDAAALAKAMSRFATAAADESAAALEVKPTFAPGNVATGEVATGGVATAGVGAGGIGAAGVGAGNTSTQGSDEKPQVGHPLPPLSRRSGPRIAGHTELIAGGNARATRIRFWSPTPEAEVFQRALNRCRALHRHRAGSGPSNPGDNDPIANPPNSDLDWIYLEIILTHFILEHIRSDKRSTLQYKILTRDDFLCGIPTCTSRANFQAHHIWWRSDGGPDDPWNLITLCAAHHQMVHEGIVEIGGWAPWALIIRQGVDPRNNRAADAFRNGRRTSDESAREWMAHWRKWCRTRGQRTKQVFRQQKRCRSQTGGTPPGGG